MKKEHTYAFYVVPNNCNNLFNPKFNNVKETFAHLPLLQALQFIGQESKPKL